MSARAAVVSSPFEKWTTEIKGHTRQDVWAQCKQGGLKKHADGGQSPDRKIHMQEIPRQEIDMQGPTYYAGSPPPY